MEKIKLISDSTCDLTKELIEELDLEVVPLIVSFEDDQTSYKDGVDIDEEMIVEHVTRTGKLPVSGAVGPGVFEEVFNKYLNDGYSIIYTGIGSKLSSTFQSATIARGTCADPKRVTLIDSNNLSSATGLVLLKIRDFIKKGLSREEIKEKIDTEVTPYIHASFCIDTTDYLVKGGRCSSLTGFFAKALKIKPIIVVKDGKLIVGKKPIGSIVTAVKVMYQDMMAEYKNCELNYMMVTHFMGDKGADYVIPLMEENCKFKHIYNTHAGAVIGSHCGPGTLGLLYITKPKTKKEKTK